MLIFTIISALSIFLGFIKYPKFITLLAQYNSFAFITLQGWFIHRLNNISFHIETSLLDSVEIIILDFALSTTLYLGFIFSHLNKCSIDGKFGFFFMGSMQIGILITISSLSFISIQMKIWCNTLYVLLPAFVLFEIQNKNTQQKEKIK